MADIPAAEQRLSIAPRIVGAAGQFGIDPETGRGGGEAKHDRGLIGADSVAPGVATLSGRGAKENEGQKRQEKTRNGKERTRLGLGSNSLQGRESPV